MLVRFVGGPKMAVKYRKVCRVNSLYHVGKKLESKVIRRKILLVERPYPTSRKLTDEIAEHSFSQSLVGIESKRLKMLRHKRTLLDEPERAVFPRHYVPPTPQNNIGNVNIVVAEINYRIGALLCIARSESFITQSFHYFFQFHAFQSLHDHPSTMHIVKSRNERLDNWFRSYGLRVFFGDTWVATQYTMEFPTLFFEVEKKDGRVLSQAG